MKSTILLAALFCALCLPLTACMGNDAQPTPPPTPVVEEPIHTSDGSLLDDIEDAGEDLMDDAENAARNVERDVKNAVR